MREKLLGVISDLDKELDKKNNQISD